MTKRLFDISVALISLICLAPLFVVIGLLIEIDSPGPIFFRGERVGQGGKPFRILKFRSMVPHAPGLGPTVTGRDDPRVTRLGRWLRRSKLDELPSLINVLRGEMSLVGPRPEAPAWVAGYSPRHRAVLRVKPGITGPAQLKYRHEEVMLSQANLAAVYPQILRDKLEIDLTYVSQHAFSSDLRLIWQTLLALFESPARKV